MTDVGQGRAGELRFLPPMLARTEPGLPKSGEWELEVKLDGIRAVAIKDGPHPRLYSRRPRELTQDFPEIVQAIGGLRAKKLMMDGEIVALDEKGRSSFQLLQNFRNEPRVRRRIFYYAFDLMNLEGADTTSMPLAERRKLLRGLMPAQGPVRFSDSLDGPFSTVWKLVAKLGLEGVVAKRKDSTYESGRRTGAWVKIKARNEQEFVIGGYTQPDGAREFFGSILVGYYAGNRLMYAGRVGTGFDHRALESLYRQFQKLKTVACPFADLAEARVGKSRPWASPAELKRSTWIEPRLVCQVKFMEWTRDGSLRHPAFLGLREDKRALDVVREAQP